MHTLNKFSKLDLLKKLIPIASIIQGKLNAQLNFSGDLNSEFTPNLSSLTGNAIAELLTKKVDLKSSLVANALASQLKFINLDKLDLSNLKSGFIGVGFISVYPERVVEIISTP